MSRLKGNGGVRGSVWMLADRYTRTFVGFVVGVVVARYYGPAEYGQLTYVIAAAAIFGSLNTMGLDDILVRDLSTKDRLGLSREDAQYTGVILRLLGGFAAYFLLLVLVWAVQGFGIAFWLAVVFGLCLPLQSYDVYEYRLRADGDFRIIAKIRAAAGGISSGLKLLAVALGLPILLQAIVMAFEFAFNGYFLRKRALHGAEAQGRFNSAYAKDLIGQGHRFVLVGFLVLLQSRIGYFLADHFLGWDMVGQFAAALKVVELFDIVFSVLVAVALPMLARKDSLDFFVDARRIYLSGVLILGCLIPFMALACYLFPWAYGDEYKAATEIMPILIFRPALMMLFTIRGILMVLDNRSGYAVLAAGIGVIAALGLGYILSPIDGLQGLALSVIVSLALSLFLSDMFFYRKNLMAMLSCYKEWRFIRTVISQSFGKKVGC